jgi:hypothetical protein
VHRSPAACGIERIGEPAAIPKGGITVRRFWNRKRKSSDLEIELRASRPVPPPELVDRLAAATRRPYERLRGAGLRVGFAGGLTLLMLAAFAAVGGLGYAASAVTQGMSEVKSVVAQRPTTVTTSAGQDQYKPGKGCGDKNHQHERRHQCKVKVNDVSQREGNSGTTAFVFTISLNDTPIDTVTVVYSTANGTATAGSDYLPVSGTATFLPGVTTQTVTVSVVGDTVKEPKETFFLNLTSVSANALIEDGQGVGTIVNDD